MTKDPRRFRCPCCHEQLEFDPGTGKAREVDAKAEAPKQPEKAIETLLEKHAKDNERLANVFSQAKEDALHQADKFDALFNTALEAAKKDKDKKPRNPFDLD